MVTHTRNLSSAFNPSKCTLTAVNTHPEQWAAILRRPGSSWGIGALLKGLTSVVVLKVERALVIHSPTDNPCRTWESNLQPLGYKSNSLTIRPRLLVNYPFTLPLQKNCYHATFTVSAVYSMHIFCKHGNPGWAVIHLPKCALYNRAHCPEYCIL